MSTRTAAFVAVCAGSLGLLGGCATGDGTAGQTTAVSAGEVRDQVAITEAPAAPEQPAPELADADAGALAPADDNLLVNPSFELDDESWWSFHEKSPWSWGDFEITDERAHTGERSARLVMNSPESRLPARVYGVVQEVTPEKVPEYVSGWYRVEGWERGTKKQYLQVVAIAWNPENVPEGLNATNFQVAYTMAGVSETPLPNISNRSFIVTGPVEPVENEWVFFELDLANAFRRQWKIEPEGFEYLRLLFEVRYDEREKDEVVRATVYYDDLYIGDQSRALDPQTND